MTNYRDLVITCIFLGGSKPYEVFVKTSAHNRKAFRWTKKQVEERCPHLLYGHPLYEGPIAAYDKPIDFSKLFFIFATFTGISMIIDRRIFLVLFTISGFLLIFGLFQKPVR